LNESNLARNANPTSRENFFDKPCKIAIFRTSKMSTTFTKLMKQHAPVNGFAIWQRASRLVGVVGTKS
jgi:hypothetical protein